MTSARDAMHTGAECVGEHETLDAAAHRARDLDVGGAAPPRCDGELCGALTGGDVVVRCPAADGAPGRRSHPHVPCRRTDGRTRLPGAPPVFIP